MHASAGEFLGDAFLSHCGQFLGEAGLSHCGHR